MIEANDDFKVNAVSVSITDANGNLVEQGNATQQGTSDDWFYLATVAHGPLPGTNITVKATDLAGNTTTKLEVLP